jgi:hypothetical protein
MMESGVCIDGSMNVPEKVLDTGHILIHRVLSFIAGGAPGFLDFPRMIMYKSSNCVGSHRRS